MKKMTFEEFMSYSHHYVNYGGKAPLRPAKNLVEFVMQRRDKWLYIENSIFFLLHTMGLEVYLEGDRIFFYEENKRVFPEITCGDRLLSINGHDPLDENVFLLHMHCNDIHLLIESACSEIKRVVFKLPIMK